jgi:hypothetical protein
MGRWETHLMCSIACILFILVRYLGITALIMGAFGFFYHGFTKEQCDHFYWLTPIFKRVYTTSTLFWGLHSCINQCFYTLPRRPFWLSGGSRYQVGLLTFLCSLIEQNIRGVAQVPHGPADSRCLVRLVLIGAIKFS